MNTKNYTLIGTIFILTTVTLLTLGCQAFAAQYQYKGAVVNPPQPMSDFELMSATGQPFRLSDVEGDIRLIYFGYTNCPDVCPLTLWEVKTALAQLETGRERIHVIFISADPERDTPQVMANYTAAFGPEFIGLSDDWTKVESVMQTYGAFAEKEEVADSALGYTVNHSATLYLVDPQSRLLLQYPFGFEAEELSSDLAYQLRQENS
jgi:protein SCO1/2